MAKKERPTPLYLRLEPGRDAYVLPVDIVRASKENPSMVWKLEGRVRTVQRAGGGYLKDVGQFPKHAGDEDTFTEFLRECREHGKVMPSSYPDMFHHKFRMKRVKHSVNAMLAPSFRGGWEQAKMTGLLPGRWYQYDINSAYLWATTLGMPKVATFSYTDRLTVAPSLYVIETDPREDLPYPFNLAKTVNATIDEIDYYNLTVKHVYGGVTWDDTEPSDMITSILNQFSFGKEAAKTFWGRWCSMSAIECESKNGNVWKCPNPVLNLVWAHLLIARVKMRLYECCQNAAHVFVDSAIVPHEIPTGTDIGQFKHVRTYAEGVRVQGAGFYGPANGPWDKTAGMKRSA